ncbi:MAG: hypothetical protein ACI4NB_02005 [Candidatus Ornithospirochaeta sp.]
MAKITIDRNEIVFCSEPHNFYAYKNQDKRIELLLYKYYQKEGNNWILLSREGEELITYIYNLSYDFSTQISNGTVIEGAFDDATLHLLYFLMIINGLKVMTAVDEESKEVYSFQPPQYGDYRLNGTKSIKVTLASAISNIEADWSINKASQISIDEIREKEMFPSRLLDRFIPSTLALSIIKFGLFLEHSTSWFSNALSPLDTFSALPLAILNSLNDHLIKVIIKNGGSLTISRDEDIYFCDDIFSVLKREGVTEDIICNEVKNIISKALSLGLTMTNNEWRNLVSDILFHSNEYPRDCYLELCNYVLSVLPTEVISPTNNEESLIEIANDYLEKDEWEELFEKIEELEEYIEAYREYIKP